MSLAAWGMKLPCSLVVWQWIRYFCMFCQMSKWTDCGWGRSCLSVSFGLTNALSLQSPPILGHARTMPGCDVSSQNTFCCSCHNFSQTLVFHLFVSCFLLTNSHVISDPASPPCSALPVGLIHLICSTPLLTCSSSANQPPQYLYWACSLSSLPDCLVCLPSSPAFCIFWIWSCLLVIWPAFGLWTLPLACSLWICLPRWLTTWFDPRL